VTHALAIWLDVAVSFIALGVIFGPYRRGPNA
jgi:hypothetical protein